MVILVFFVMLLYLQVLLLYIVCDAIVKREYIQQINVNGINCKCKVVIYGYKWDIL